MVKAQLSVSMPGSLGRKVRHKSQDWDIAQGAVVRAALKHLFAHAEEDEEAVKKLVWAERLQ